MYIIPHLSKQADKLLNYYLHFLVKDKIRESIPIRQAGLWKFLKAAMESYFQARLVLVAFITDGIISLSVDFRLR